MKHSPTIEQPPYPSGSEGIPGSLTAEVSFFQGSEGLGQTEQLPEVRDTLDMTPPAAIAPPMTSEEITQRWGQLQGGWQRLKGALSGAVGRARSTLKEEEYDPAKHNRTVQNQLYKHLGEAPVRGFLGQHDNRYNRYAAGKVGVAERSREIAAEALVAPPMVVACLGIAALRGFANLAVRKAEPGSPLAVLATEGAEGRERKLAKSQQQAKRAAERRHAPTNARERLAAVKMRLDREKNPSPTPEELRQMYLSKKAA